MNEMVVILIERLRQERMLNSFSRSLSNSKLLEYFYQIELSASIFLIYSERVLLSPEVPTKGVFSNGIFLSLLSFIFFIGRLDFLLNIGKGGTDSVTLALELLRNGINLDEHLGRFREDGKYTVSNIKYDDYALLDYYEHDCDCVYEDCRDFPDHYYEIKFTEDFGRARIQFLGGDGIITTKVVNLLPESSVHVNW